MLMNGIPPQCKHFQDEIDDLQQQVESLQRDLQTAPPPPKSDILKEIRELRKEIRLLDDQLDACVNAPT